MNWRSRIYNAVKPLIPRSVQIVLRRRFVARVMRRTAALWPIDPAAGGRPAAFNGWPAGCRFALVLTHDVEDQRGVERCLALASMERDLGFVSSFNFVPEKYNLSGQILDRLVKEGFEVGVHDLRHDGRLFESRRVFMKRAGQINRYLRAWNSVGFRSGSMYHNLHWMHDLEIQYDSSTFDTDPFEPQPDGVQSLFPIWIRGEREGCGYVELPYTLPQDMTLFVLFRHRDTRAWQDKLAWIAERGGMALVVTHPDYMYWGDGRRKVDEYPFELYRDFLLRVASEYRGQYWNALPRELAGYWRRHMVTANTGLRAT